MKLLLIEDNIADVALMEAVLEEVDAPGGVSLDVIKDGETAMSRFAEMESQSSEFFPDLILLDYNLPRVNGLDILKKLKQSHTLRMIPVVVFSTSSSRDDIESCYREHANCFITKPVDFDEFIKIIHHTVIFWSRTSAKPYMA